MVVEPVPTKVKTFPFKVATFVLLLESVKAPVEVDVGLVMVNLLLIAGD